MEYHSIDLELKKNREKYEEIMSTKDQQDSFNSQFS